MAKTPMPQWKKVELLKDTHVVEIRQSLSGSNHKSKTGFSIHIYLVTYNRPAPPGVHFVSILTAKDELDAFMRAQQGLRDLISREEAMLEKAR